MLIDEDARGGGPVTAHTLVVGQAIPGPGDLPSHHAGIMAIMGQDPRSLMDELQRDPAALIVKSGATDGVISTETAPTTETTIRQIPEQQTHGRFADEIAQAIDDAPDGTPVTVIMTGVTDAIETSSLAQVGRLIHVLIGYLLTLDNTARLLTFIAQPDPPSTTELSPLFDVVEHRRPRRS